MVTSSGRHGRRFATMLLQALRTWLDRVVVIKFGAGLDQYSQGDGKSHENSALLSNFFVFFYN